MRPITALAMLGSLTLALATVGAAPTQVGGPGAPAKRLRGPKRSAPPPPRLTRQELLTPPLSSIAPTPQPLGNLEEEARAAQSASASASRPRGRIYITAEGIAIGDYFIQPRIVLGTDNRYDDANTRERALRDDLDAMESRRHGELHQDPLSRLIYKYQHNNLNPNEPGFRLASTISEILQLAVQVPVSRQLLYLGARSLGSPAPALPDQPPSSAAASGGSTLAPRPF